MQAKNRRFRQDRENVRTGPLPEQRPYQISRLFCSGKVDSDRRALTGVALEFNLRAVVLCGMLDDGKAKTGAANLLGMTFIDAVKSLKYTALVGVGNTNASIYDGECCRRPILPDGNGNIAARNVIFDCVVAQIIEACVLWSSRAAP